MAVTKMEIQAFENKEFSGNPAKTFTALINPSSIRHHMSVNVQTTAPASGKKPEGNFQNYNAETLSFQLILDGTGLVDGPKVNEGKKVKELVDEFVEVTYKLKEQTHEPSYAKVLWGDFKFQGRLTALEINYTLFDPQGVILRAKLDATFSSSKDLDSQARTYPTASPDLTHTFIVKEGDTLPFMCNTVYNDSCKNRSFF